MFANWSTISLVAAKERPDAKHKGEAADRFVTVSDEQAQEAVALLASHGLRSTPSGAAGLAGMIANSPGPDAEVLIFVTEGDVA